MLFVNLTSFFVFLCVFKSQISQMDRLNDDLLWHLFLRLDFLEFDVIRRTSPQFEALVGEEAFLKAYHTQGRGSVRNFMHFYNPTVRQVNRIVGQREEDQRVVNYGLHEGDNIELLGAFRNILLFVSVHSRHWFIACNLVTMTARVIHLPYWLQLSLEDFELRTRIVEDDADPLHYIFLFAFAARDRFRGDIAVDYFTYRSNPHNQLFIPVGREAEIESLTAQERRHPLYMCIPEMQDDITRFVSIRNARPVYMFETDEYVYHRIPKLPPMPNIWPPEFAPF